MERPIPLAAPLMMQTLLRNVSIARQG
jgi:hypothetical protein